MPHLAATSLSKNNAHYAMPWSPKAAGILSGASSAAESIDYLCINGPQAAWLCPNLQKSCLFILESWPSNKGNQTSLLRKICLHSMTFFRWYFKKNTQNSKVNIQQKNQTTWATWSQKSAPSRCELGLRGFSITRRLTSHGNCTLDGLEVHLHRNDWTLVWTISKCHLLISNPSICFRHIVDRKIVPSSAKP